MATKTKSENAKFVLWLTLLVLIVLDLHHKFIDRLLGALLSRETILELDILVAAVFGYLFLRDTLRDIVRSAVADEFKKRDASLS